MNVLRISFLLIAVLCLSCKGEKNEPEATVDEAVEVVKEEVKKATPKELTVTLENKSDSQTTGIINFKEIDGVVIMNGKFNGLSEGVHAIHLHEKADCSSADGKSTGGHWNPTDQPHGEWGDEAGYHKGDIGNFEADANGTGSITFKTDQWCIGCDDTTKNIIGTAVIVQWRYG